MNKAPTPALVWPRAKMMSVQLRARTVLTRCMAEKTIRPANYLNHRSTMCQRRHYLFLPATKREAVKWLKSWFDDRQQTHQRLMVKVQSRWDITFDRFRKKMKSRIGTLANSADARRRAFTDSSVMLTRARAARTSLQRRSLKYSLLMDRMRGRVGRISHKALSHYNAKKRVYARRRVSRQLARTVAANQQPGSSSWDRWAWIGAKFKLRRSIWRGVTLTEPAQRSWFDEEGFPLTSRDPETGRFVNPWLSESTNGESGLWNFLRWKVGGSWERLVGGGAKNDRGEHQGGARAPSAQVLSSMETRNNGSPHAEKEKRINLTWIGHSTTLVQFPGDFAIITDPHFSNYAGPVRRHNPPALSVEDLPDVVDCALISHDHMDHCEIDLLAFFSPLSSSLISFLPVDYWSILSLIDSDKVKHWIVPLGIKAWLIDKTGLAPERIIELEWWEGVRLSKVVRGDGIDESDAKIIPEVEGLVKSHKDLPKATGDSFLNSTHQRKNELVVTCAPAQHWCSRTPFDRNRRLWCSFSVRATLAYAENLTERAHSFYFAGDTALPPNGFPLHQQIGDRLGPFDLAAIPIGAYEPEWFMRETHCNPAEAVLIHKALGAKRSVAIHHNTFNLSDEPGLEPQRRLNEVIFESSNPMEDFRVIEQGDSVQAPT